MSRSATPGGTNIPQPPEGYRYATVEEALDKGVKILRCATETIIEWIEAGLCGTPTVEQLSRVEKLRDILKELP